MFELNVKDTVNFDAVVATIAQMDKAIQMKLAKFMQARAKQYAPVDTGFLRDNIVIQDDGDITRVVSLADYSSFVEFGSYSARHGSSGRFASQEDYPITSLTPKGRIGGERFRAKYAGYSAQASTPTFRRGHFFMTRALQDTLEAFPNIARASWMEVEANPKNSELGVHASQFSGSSFGGAGGGLISALGVGFD